MRFLLGVALRHLVKPWPPVLRDTQLLLQWAVSSALLIGAVLAVRRLLAGKLSCRLRYALWGVVLLRLLVPFQLPVSVPVTAAGLAPEVPQSWEERDVPVFPYSTVDFEKAHPHYERVEPGGLGPTYGSDFYIQRSGDGRTLTYYTDIFTRDEVVQAVWWTGVLAAALALLVSNLRFAVRLEDRRRPLEVPGCPLPVYGVEGLPSPCLFGLFRPAVYLTPETAEDGPARSHVLAHELTHWAHRDHVWAFLRCLALALHWYNPLVWLAAVLSKRDGELACDEGAVARLGEDQRIPYGRTLVDMVARRSLRPGDLLSCSTAMAQGRKTIQQRVALLVKKPETKKTALFAALAAVALAAVFTFAGGEAEEAPGNEYPQFRDQAASAQAIHVGMPPISSLAYPEPITDDDLLQEARELLLQARGPLNLPEDLDLNRAPFDSYTVTLSGSGFSESYYFSTQNGETYVVTPAEIGAEEYTAIAVLEGSVPASLMSLAKEQQERNRAPSTQQESEPEGVRPVETVNSADLDPIREEVDRVLASELDAQNRWLADFSGAQYTGIQLTGFRLLSSYPDLLEDSVVKLYYLDYGLSIDDLSQAGWAGGAYAGDDGLFHPYGPTLHLLTVEREGEVQSWSTVLWEFLLEPGQEGVDIVDGDYVRDVVVSNLRDLLDPVVPAPVEGPEQAVRAYGEALARYYLSLGEGHPQYVTYARLAGYTVEQQRDTGAVARIALAVDPAEPNTVSWMAGAGIDYQTGGEWAGHWFFELEYMLERQEDGSWRCTDRGTGGCRLPEFDWNARLTFSPEQRAASSPEVDLRATVTRPQMRPSNGGENAFADVTGQTGALEELSVGYGSLILRFDPEAELGTALGGLLAAAPQERAELARWLRVSLNGESVSLTLRSSEAASLWFAFDEHIPLAPGDTLQVELGPAR